jgi:hypothetical protein
VLTWVGSIVAGLWSALVGGHGGGSGRAVHPGLPERSGSRFVEQGRQHQQSVHDMRARSHQQQQIARHAYQHAVSQHAQMHRRGFGGT